MNSKTEAPSPSLTSPQQQQRSREEPRQRASSIKLVLQHVTNLPPSDHPFSSTNFDQTQLLSPPITNLNEEKEKEKPSNQKKPIILQSWEESSKGFWHDLRTMRWMRHPGTSFRMILIFLSLWILFYLLKLPNNPISPFILISYPLPLESDETYHKYGKGSKDVLFLSFYIIVFSFIRQTITEYLIKPYSSWLGLRGTKQQRFIEQGYAVFYWGSATIIGLSVMSKQPTWWYNTAEFWKSYPHYRMEPSVKTYYLLQFSYWLQQMLLLSLRIEKPRSDFVELVIHHFVTLWLVGWSYVTNLTMIGTAIFVSMDISDTFLGISKCINYTKYQHTSEFSFAIFLCIWTYFRHYQNLRILYSVYYEFDTEVPLEARRWVPKDEVYLVGWMKWQIFGPIMMLQFLNLFWYFLIWRIVFRMIWVGNVVDVREEGETDDEEGTNLLPPSTDSFKPKTE
ncbi:hypothetical protein CROQUDRAFT_662675 [Cronartium quercuum f. sp. fusiforme G11]|uniref:TLC domain-containing protein n=1 Tax=Cronartium quercuum f. sp. fusiforme G11 TaxID=708437 RepID=A0A9P6T7Q8_9BASI|nr:hypothetical protein CROQUDRAFT_662675 [Cronartium quercuum f. sp. fusiforme G11]